MPSAITRQTRGKSAATGPTPIARPQCAPQAKAEEPTHRATLRPTRHRDRRPGAPVKASVTVLAVHVAPSRHDRWNGDRIRAGRITH
jgi:hypothetical protein